MTDAAEGAIASGEARATFESWGLELPPIPPPFADTIRRTRDQVWSTRSDITDPTGFMGFVEEAATQDVADYLVLGRGGRGATDQAVHYYLVNGPVRVLVQVGLSNAYRDADDEVRGARKTLAEIPALLDAASDAMAAGVLKPDQRLIVAAADFDFSGWCILPGQVDPSGMLDADWADEADTIRAVTVALRARS